MKTIQKMELNISHKGMVPPEPKEKQAVIEDIGDMGDDDVRSSQEQAPASDLERTRDVKHR